MNPDPYKIFSISLLLILVVVLIGCNSSNSTKNVTVLEGATLIIGDSSVPIERSVVIIENDKIIEVGILGEISYPEDAEVINLKGRWILPGFMDLHFHIFNIEQLEVLNTLLQFGVTTIRNAAASPEFGVELKEKLINGEIIGPRMLTAGELIDITGGFWSNAPNAVGVETVEEIKAEVRRQAGLGVDFVKLYAHLEPDLIQAGIEEAKSLGLKTMGHLGKTGWGHAAEMGINALTHSGTATPTWELVPVQQRSRFKDFFAPHQKPEFDHTLIGPWYALVDLDGPEMAKMVSSIVKNNVEVNPTLVTEEVMFWGDDPNIREALLPNYAPVNLRNKWGEGPHPYTASWSKESLDQAKKVFQINQEIVRRLHEAGVLITIGTDFPLPWITPGVALHREMLLLYNAGIPALDVITIATRNGAEALGILDEVGTIEIGKQADFVVLSADPLEDIRNTRKIESVYLDGNLVHSLDGKN